MDTLLGTFFLVYGIFALSVHFWVVNDYQKRKFLSISEKKNWRKKIFGNPIGSFFYYYKFVIKNKV